MPVPKKRHSKTRTSTRRANWKVKSKQNLSKCSQCGSPILPYHACRKCGTYKGRAVIDIKSKEKKENKEKKEK